MPIANDKVSGNAMGGTEIMKIKLAAAVEPALLDKFQIFVSRVHEPLSDKHVRILWCQDLAGDPESDHLKNEGWKKFHKIIFSSFWQMRGFIEMYKIPWSKCIVIHNGIEPIEWKDKKRDGTIRLVYTPTPHRGLNILLPVFDELSQEYDNIELDVFSSFKLYGWEERDKPFQELFDKLKEHPKVNYHGTVPNDELRTALQNAHIFAYPSIWQETSCLCLMEAMSAGLLCVHSSLGALPETSANWTYMYQYDENMNGHANMFYSVLRSAIEDVKNLKEEEYIGKIRTQKAYVDVFNNWNLLKMQWVGLLQSLENEPTAIEKDTGPMFTYRT
jgi:UDP-glucose:(glucosyl)LPS alpha-1,2-glucosyltransferase